MYIQEDEKVVVIESVKKGDYFRLLGAKRVYVADGYNRSTRRYSAYRFDDICHYIEKKKGALVEVNFDF